MNYNELKAKFETAKNKEQGKPVANNTRIFQRGKDYAIQLHNTDIITISPNNTITLNSGGWNTVTTKERMSYAVTIRSVKGVWQVLGKNFEVLSEYYDGIKIRNGKVVSKVIDPNKKMNEVKKLKAKIKKYVDGFGKMIEEGKLEDPTSGDCLYCLAKEDPTSGDCLYCLTHMPGTLHFESHIEENYFVPSLLVRAIESAGLNVSIWFMMIREGKDSKSAKRFLTKYLIKKLMK